MTSTWAWASSSDAGRQAPRRRRRRGRAAAGASLALALGAGPAAAEVFHARDEALALAFPAGTVVEPRTVFLTDAQVAAVRERAGVAVESKLFTYHTGRRDGRIVGWAVIETHTVRTLPETVLAVVTPEGAIERVLLLAFYEPPEYRPPVRWMEQFEGRRLSAGEWRVGRDLHGISGATLTAQAISDALRRILVLHELVMRPPGS
jgi:hypothetical protein